MLVVMAGIEGGVMASSGRRAAIVFVQMPLTRHAGRLLGVGGVGRGGMAVRRSDLATILRSVFLGAPGSSLETRSYRFRVFWICLFFCLTVGAAAGFFVSGLAGADVAAAAT